MRLLHLGNDGELSLVEFAEDEIPPYAILSHTWSQETKEISYSVFESGDYKTKLEYKESYRKIYLCGEQAHTDGLKYFWVDTCCINKDSSAELSEAINSMYTWYRQADFCYAYLSDVDGKDNFCNSRWFQRGWTLQEMLAPADVLFFDKSWRIIGYKTSLSPMISARTKINEKALFDGSSLQGYSIAEKMSWAADRQTTRTEDEAYCLMGLFNINMPLIYGEGRKAFVRLQEELLKWSDDASIFAYSSSPPWTSPGPLTWLISQNDVNPQATESNVPIIDESPWRGTEGLFASSPKYYHSSADFKPYPALNGVARMQKKPGQLGLRVRRSGHLIKLQIIMWKLPFLKCLVGSQEDGFAFQKAMVDSLGVSLDVMSIQRFQKCAQHVDMRNWSVAFLDCCRDDGGIVGIVVRENIEKGTYTRQHFPSIVEVTDVGAFFSSSAIQIRTIYIEADSLRPTATANHLDPGLLMPPNLDRSQEHALFRIENLYRFGFRKIWTVDDEVLRHQSDATLPLIRVTAQRHGVLCRTYLSEGHGSMSGQRLNSSQPISLIFIPKTPGSVVEVHLNESTKLILKNQMQWKRHKSDHFADGLTKHWLVTFSIAAMSPEE